MSLLVETKRRVLRITLNRPEKRNALTSDMCKGIVEAVQAAENDAEIGSILISGVGQVFCAGMDLDEAASPAGLELGPVHERLFSIGFESHKPIIVAVNGAALGGGLGLAAQGHVVLAEQSSVFCLPEVRIGLWPFLVYRAVEASIGARRTLALSLTARNFHAHEALAWGLVHKVCPDDELTDRACNLARDIAKACPTAVHAGMCYAHTAHGKSWHEAGLVAGQLRDELMKSEDFREGVAAFKQKREPSWPSMPQSFYKNGKGNNGA
jgi:enoyl-CoA hydratase/carnithine racemase